MLKYYVYILIIYFTRVFCAYVYTVAQNNLC
jgi:hypothetical protein